VKSVAKNRFRHPKFCLSIGQSLLKIVSKPRILMLLQNPLREERVRAMHEHFPVNCFVPPHILKNIATKGTEGQKNLAIDTLKVSAQMRGQRQALADFTAATFRVAVGGKERVIYDARNGASLPGTVVRREGDAAVSDVATPPSTIAKATITPSGMASRWSMAMAMKTCR
jgi:hypothetical protein